MFFVLLKDFSSIGVETIDLELISSLHDKYGPFRMHVDVRQDEEGLGEREWPWKKCERQMSERVLNGQCSHTQRNTK